MRTIPRTLPLEIVRNHMLARIGGAAVVIDTGSPLTMRAPAIVGEQLGQPVRWLVGTDTLTRDRVLLDWPNGRMVLGGPALRGESIPLVPHAGLFQVEVEGAHGSMLAFLDTGAHLSYAPASVVRGLEPVAHQSDYYPLLGEFNVPVYELSVRVGRRQIKGRFGVLPYVLATLLSGVGGTRWILGSDFFRDRAIQLDLASNRLIDATVVAPRERTTRRSVGHRTMTDSVRGAGVDAWRGWRLTDVAGEPRIQSLTSRDVWDGPCFTSDELPDAGGRPRGVHAYVTPMQMHALQRGPALVYGQVTLHGQVCVHEMGYRAEHARIDRLFLRACGRHVPHHPPLTGVFLLDVVNFVPPSYCACDALAPGEWLDYGQLETLAHQLGDRYQCDVTIDAERARTSPYDCPHTRRRPHTRNLQTRSA